MRARNLIVFVLNRRLIPSPPLYPLAASGTEEVDCFVIIIRMVDRNRARIGHICTFYVYDNVAQLMRRLMHPAI